MRLASKIQIIAAEARPSTMTPFEKTRRSPRFTNCDGRNRSRARIEASRGKSWYAVFAARIKIAEVKNCTIKKPIEPSPKTAMPI